MSSDHSSVFSPVTNGSIMGSVQSKTTNGSSNEGGAVKALSGGGSQKQDADYHDKKNSHVLKFRKISFSVRTTLNAEFLLPSFLRKISSDSTKCKSTDDVILQDVSGQVCSGEFMAIMGPSGAGKTSFLKTLALQNFGGTCTGTVQLDGEHMDIDIFREKCAIVEQHDTLWPILTTREHLKYAADFIFSSRGNGAVAKEKESTLEDLLDTLNLRVCADTRASNLSGGQRRRLSLAIVMMKAPQVLYLDEPTSGLDAASAATVINCLRQLAQTKNLIIICTIHQPSSKIFALFTHVTLLSKGRSVYSGLNGSDILSYFKEAGYSLPVNTNPAEFLIDCVSSTADTSTSIQQKWEVAEQDNEGWNDNPHLETGELPTKKTYGLSAAVHLPGKSGLERILSEQKILVSRMLLTSIRDTQAYFARAVFFLFVTVFISTFYIQTRDRTVEFAIERVIQMGWFFAVPSLLMIVHVYQSCIEYTKMSHEFRLGFYHPISYALARVLVEIPFMFMLSFSALGIGGFVIGRFETTAFWSMILLYTGMLYALETTAEVCSALFSDVNANMLFFVILWFASFLCSEIWVAESDVVLALRPIFYLSPFRLSLRAFIYLDFSTATFSCGDGLSLIHYIDGGECLGDYDGNFLLDVIGNVIFPTVTSDVNVPWCLGVTLLIALGMKIMYVLLIKRRLGVSTKLSSTSDLERNSKNTSYMRCFKLLILVFTIIGGYIGVLIWISSKEKAYGAQECVKSLYDLGFRLDDVENYDKYFDENSKMILPQAGKYEGPVGILEYFLFVTPVSPYLSKSEIPRSDRHFLGYDEETGICSFIDIIMLTASFDATITGSDKKYSLTAMTRTELDPEKQVIKNVFVDFEEPYLSYFFNELAKTNDTREFICSVMADDCSMPEENCLQKLASLPVAEGPHFHVDGNSQGCRFVHTIMATLNKNHCAHIAFEPTPDDDGNIKCQESLGLLRSDFFDDSDIELHRIFQKNVGIEAGKGYKTEGVDL